MLPKCQSTRQLHLEDVLGLLPWIPAGPVVDIGAGQGYLSAAMAAWGFSVTALDVDEEALAAARRRFGDQVHWLHEDIRSHRLNRESQAAIFCLNVLPYIPHGERARLIGRLKAAVKPGGLLLISGYTTLDPVAEQRLATSINRLDRRPTGVLSLGELPERFKEWEILFFFEGWVAEAHTPEGGVERHHVSQIIARKPISVQTISKSIPASLGVGLTWEAGIFQKDLSAQPDFVELPFEQWFKPSEDHRLLRLLQHVPGIIHVRGLGEALRQSLPELQRLLARCDSPWWVLCLALWSYRTGFSLPLPPARTVWEQVFAQIRALQNQVPTPLLLQNSLISFSLGVKEGELMAYIAEACDCGLSLDLGLLCQSATALGFHPADWLDPIPAERVLALRLPSDHDLSWYADAWRLARHILAQSPIQAISLEPLSSPERLGEQIMQARRWLKETQEWVD